MFKVNFYIDYEKLYEVELNQLPKVGEEVWLDVPRHMWTELDHYDNLYDSMSNYYTVCCVRLNVKVVSNCSTDVFYDVDMKLSKIANTSTKLKCWCCGNENVNKGERCLNCGEMVK